MRNQTANLAPLWGITKLHARRTLVARVDLLSNIAFGVLLAYGLAFLWQALYRSEFVPADVPIDSMVTYAILGSVVTTSLQTGIVYYANWRIKTGDIIFDILRPINWQVSLLGDFFGTISVQFVAVAVPVITISAVFLDFQPPASVIAGIVFVPSLLLGALVSYAIVFLILLLGFRYTQVGGIESAMRGFRPLLTGALVPLWFFPDGVATAMEQLPFPAIAFTPLSIYIGETEGADMWIALARQIGWAAALIGIGAYFAQRGMNKLSVQGG